MVHPSSITNHLSLLMTIHHIPLEHLTESQLLQWKAAYAGLNAAVEVSLPANVVKALPEQMPMNEDQFWQIIAQLDWERQGNDDAVIEPCVQVLARLPETAIQTFYDLLSEKLYLLDGRQYADHSLLEEGNISADLFLYARCAVVANGRNFHENVLRNPGSFPQNICFEAILSISERA